MLSVSFSYCFAVCHYAGCFHAECHGAVTMTPLVALAVAVVVTAPIFAPLANVVVAAAAAEMATGAIAVGP